MTSPTDRRMPLGSPRKAAGAFSEGGSYPTSQERIKLISELLMALERLLPKLTDFKQRKKIGYEIDYHRRMLAEARAAGVQTGHAGSVD